MVGHYLHWPMTPTVCPSPTATRSVLAWRSTYERVGGYDESFAVGTDTDWLLRVRAAGFEVGLIAEELTERRWHDANASLLAERPAHNEITRSLRRLIQERRAAE